MYPSSNKLLTNRTEGAKVQLHLGHWLGVEKGVLQGEWKLLLGKEEGYWADGNDKHPLLGLPDILVWSYVMSIPVE